MTKNCHRSKGYYLEALLKSVFFRFLRIDCSGASVLEAEMPSSKRFSKCRVSKENFSCFSICCRGTSLSSQNVKFPPVSLATNALCSGNSILEMTHQVIEKTFAHFEKRLCLCFVCWFPSNASSITMHAFVSMQKRSFSKTHNFILLLDGRCNGRRSNES